MSFLKKNWLASVTLGLFLIALPIVLFEVQRQQTLRSRAAGDGSIVINGGALVTDSQSVVLTLTAPWPGQSGGTPISVPGSLPIGSRIFSSRVLATIIKPVKAQGSYSCEISTWTVDPSGKDGCSQGQYCVQFSVSYSGDVAYPVQQRWPWGWNSSNQETFRGYSYGSGSQTINLTAVDGDGKRLTATCDKTIDIPGSNTPTVSTTPASQTQTQQTQTSPSQGQTSTGSCTIYTDLVDPTNQSLISELNQKGKSNYLEGCKDRDFCVRYTLQTDSLGDDNYVQWNFGNGVDFNSLPDARTGYTFRAYNSNCSVAYIPSAKVFNKDGQEVASCSKDKEPVSLCKTVSQPAVTPVPTSQGGKKEEPKTPVEEPQQTQPSESPTPVPAPRFTKEFRTGNSETELLTKPWRVWVGDSMNALHTLTAGVGQKTVYAQFRSVDNVASKVISASILHQPPVQTGSGSVSIRPPSCPTGYLWDGSKCAQSTPAPTSGSGSRPYTPPSYFPPPLPSLSETAAPLILVILVGDINQDREVDGLDRELLIWSWSASGLEPQAQGADLNGDGRVNTVDLAIIDEKLK